MSFSWNQWRQYIIEEASVNEEIHEGVWGLGSPGRMKDYIDKLKDVYVMDDASEIQAALKGMNSALFNIFGSDDFHDIYDRAKRNLKAVDTVGLDTFKNDLSDLIVKAREMHADQIKNYSMMESDVPNDFGNDDESRFQFVAYRLSMFPDKKEQLKPLFIDMIDAMDEDDKTAFDTAFVKAMQIMGYEDKLKEGSLVNPEAEEIDPEDLDAAADYFDSLEEDRKPGFSNKAIIDSFMEDFAKATMSTGDIQDAQQEVIMAYKTTFKNFPGVSDAIDAAVMDMDRKTRRDVFQNVADDPDVVGRDMMAEAMVATFNVGDVARLIIDPKDGYNQPGPDLEVLRVEPQIGGRSQNILVKNYRTGEKQEYDNSQLALVRLGKISQAEEPMIGELEGEVQTEIDAFDEALNDMAFERAEVAKKLDAMQNDLEATLSQDEIDTLSDAIVLLRQK